MVHANPTDNELKPGKRISLSALGKTRCPRIKVQTGVIVAYASRGGAMRVLLDGSKGPITLHKSYIEPQ